MHQILSIVLNTYITSGRKKLRFDFCNNFYKYIFSKMFKKLIASPQVCLILYYISFQKQIIRFCIVT